MPSSLITTSPGNKLARAAGLSGSICIKSAPILFSTPASTAWRRAMRVKPVAIRTAAAEQATAAINRPGPLSVGERRLRRDLVLRDDGFGPREIFQQALAGQDKEVIAELRVLEVDLEQLFVADS